MTLEDIKEYGKENGVCPYFALRRMVRFPLALFRHFLPTLTSFPPSDHCQMPLVDVIIYSFHYLLDPKVADQVSKELAAESIVVFDEAHNIDNVCIESLSIDLTRPILESAAKSVGKLSEKIEECVLLLCASKLR